MAIQNSELDFFQIKSQLQSHFEQQEEFRDYDFSASGLSNILDVLAHNTHINALTANMAINESFLSSSQLRSSVVSHAESLGYVPKSRVASTALVSLSVTDNAAGSAFLTIPLGTEFSGSVGNNVYSFTTQERCTAYNESGTFEFKTPSGSPSITLKEGVKKTKTFIVDKDSLGAVYVIPDDTLDVSTISVRVYDNYLSTNFETFNDINTVATVTDSSRVYIIRETPKGQYEIFFSDGNILGVAPLANNRIEVEYISSRGASANGAISFATAFTVDNKNITVGLVAGSAGGAEKESINSIKLNAPRAFTTQNRLVTASDYTARILSGFSSYVDDAITWGGNENVPPQYGKVFVSLKFADGLSAATQKLVQADIKSQLIDNLSIMSIDTEFVAPAETFLELTTVFNIDPIKSPLSTQALQVQVDQYIVQYMADTTTKFGAIFRRSNLLSKIDELSSAVLNSKMSIRAQQRINVSEEIASINIVRQGLPTPLSILNYLEREHTVNFPFRLASPDNDDHTITSSLFKSNGQNVLIQNELGSSKLQLVDINGVLKVPNVGSYDADKGIVSISSLRIDENGYVGTGIKISAVPANQSTLNPLRNYTVTLDESLSSTTGYADAGATKVIV
jgi:hypothetical protein